MLARELAAFIEGYILANAPLSYTTVLSAAGRISLISHDICPQ